MVGELLKLTAASRCAIPYKAIAPSCPTSPRPRQHRLPLAGLIRDHVAPGKLTRCRVE